MGNISDLIGSILEADEGEKFSVDGLGYLLAKKVKRDRVTLDTPRGPITGSLVIDFADKLGVVGIDNNDIKRIFVRQGTEWTTGTLSLKDPRANEVELGIGSSGFQALEKPVAEGKIPTAELLDDELVKSLIEAIVKPGQSVRIRNNTTNKELHPELIGKIGKIVQEYHEHHGLYYDVKIDGTEEVVHLDWRDIEPAQVEKEETPQIDTGGQSFAQNNESKVNEEWNAETKSTNLGAQAGLRGVSNDISDEEIKKQYGEDVLIPNFRQGMETAQALKKAHRPVNLLVGGRPVTEQPFTSSAAAMQYAMMKLPSSVKYELAYGD